MENKHILLVDPEPEAAMLEALERTLAGSAQLEICHEFREARRRLSLGPPDLLVTNIRLEAYNGLHLVVLALSPPTRCITYASPDDVVLARQAQALGAFYEHKETLSFSIQSYLNNSFSGGDRRDPITPERRRSFREGRRCTDLLVVHRLRASARVRGAF
jgi:DNA-binding NtrC family response regulator